MQDHRDRLRKDKRGVLDLPIKLVIVMLILSISLPMLVDAVETNEKEMVTTEMEQEVRKITNAVSVVHYSGAGASRTVDLNIPAGCEITIGGDGSKAYSIRSVYNGELLSTTYLEKPIVMISNETMVVGHSALLLRSVYYGNAPGIEVTRI